MSFVTALLNAVSLFVKLQPVVPFEKSLLFNKLTFCVSFFSRNVILVTHNLFSFEGALNTTLKSDAESSVNSIFVKYSLSNSVTIEPGAEIQLLPL